METRSIRGTPYTVSRCGKVFSPFGRNLSPWIENNSGYLLIRIRVNKKRKCLRLHRIIAECWLPNPENKKYVKHKNDNKNDNSVDNLEWGDVSDNTQEGYDNKCYHSEKRSHGIKVINKDTTEELFFKSIRSAAEELNLNRKNITAIPKDRKTNTYNYEFYYITPND